MEEENMEGMWIVLALALAVNMAKKKTTKRFGQVTLSGTRALDWMRPGRVCYPQGITMGTTESLRDAGWSIPEWADGKDVWLIHQRDDPTGMENRGVVMVTQRSLIRHLDRWASAAEDEGATVDTDEHGNSTLTVSEDITTMWTFNRDTSKTFAPYTVDVGSE